MDVLAAMRIFVRVVESGSFTAAARETGRSKAGVSHTITSLEESLGVALLRRTTRSSSLTESGEHYYRRCLEILEQVDSLDSSVRAQSDSFGGVLRVTAPPGFAARYLNVLTSEFRQDHHGVSIDLHLTYRMVDLIQEGFDLAIRVTDPEDSTLVARKLSSAPVVAVASPAYLARRGTPSLPEDLVRHDCLVDTNFRDQQRWKFHDDRNGRDEKGERTVRVSGPFRINSPTSLCELAAAGLGIALVPWFVVEPKIKDGTLVEVLHGTVAMNWSVYAVYPRRRYLPARVRAYVDHLVKCLA